MAALDFDTFFDRHFDPVARALTLATGSRDLAEDATQDAFTKALRRWRRVRQMDRPDGWVYVVAMNAARDRARKAERTSTPAPEPAVDHSGGVAVRLTVRDAIATLPPRQREAVVLRFLADLSLDEVATAMGCAVGTVKATLHQAMGALRVELDEQLDQDYDDAN
jgi:RNA polymerase sigma-70 factor (ECF subfamily)